MSDSARQSVPARFASTHDLHTPLVHLADMALSDADIQRIAHLARIEVTSAEAAAVAAKLDGIFELVGRMRAIDTRGILPMSHAHDVTLPLRDDRVTESDQRDVLQRTAPASQDGLYLVPRVIE